MAVGLALIHVFLYSSRLASTQFVPRTVYEKGAHQESESSIGPYRVVLFAAHSKEGPKNAHRHTHTHTHTRLLQSSPRSQRGTGMSVRDGNCIELK